MLKIRLTRVGKKKFPQYRIVVMNSIKKRDGAYVAKVGHYDPNTNPAKIEIDQEAVKLWLSRGAQFSEGLQRLLQHRSFGLKK